MVNRPQEVNSTSYSTEQVATKKPVTRYDIVDEVYDSKVESFQVNQKDVNIIDSEVAYDTVTTTRDNYVTLNKLCGHTEYREKAEHYIENIVEQKEVLIEEYEEVWRTRDVTTYEEQSYTDYINKKVTVCDSSSSDEGYGYGHGWESSSDDCQIVWKKVAVTKTKSVPVVTQEKYLNKEPTQRWEIQDVVVQVPRVRVLKEPFTVNEPCTETINVPTTTTN